MMQIKILIFTILLISLFSTYAHTETPKTCQLAQGMISIENNLSNWKYDSASFAANTNSCTLEKKDSVENPVYANSQIQVFYTPHQQISGDFNSYVNFKTDSTRREEGVTDLKLNDATFAGKKAKLMTYQKNWKSSFDEGKSTLVSHKTYLVVEPNYIVDIITYAPQVDTQAFPEIEKLIQTIKLK